MWAEGVRIGRGRHRPRRCARAKSSSSSSSSSQPLQYSVAEGDVMCEVLGLLNVPEIMPEMIILELYGVASCRLGWVTVRGWPSGIL